MAQACAEAQAAGKASPSAFTQLRAAGVEYRYAARLTVRSPQATWVAAALARDGMVTLDPRYTRAGIGNRGSVYVVLVVDGRASSPAPLPTPAPEPGPPTPPAPPPAPAPGEDGPVGDKQAFLTADERAMVELVNAARREAGLAPLVPDPVLTELARMKARDMVERQYFSHYSPTYGSPFDMMRAHGVSYRYAGENIAGAPTVAGAHNALMQSPGHRANILGTNYTKIGIGIVDGGPYGKMFVQLFTG
ncbi:MAG: CAP domain-containing protein [Desulfotomaculales bacterium]